jgi:HSP20 family protein
LDQLTISRNKRKQTHVSRQRTKATTMKLHLAAVTLPALATGYSMGGYNMFGRPVIISGTKGSCYSPQQVAQLRQQQQEFVNRAFENLASELNDARSTTNRAPRRQVNTMSEETIRQQKEWLNRAFGLATEVASGLAASPDEVKESKEAIGQQKEWVSRAFDMASDVASGLTSPRYEINDDDEAFQVALDVPGVKSSDIDISVVEEDGQQVLTVRGQREIGKDDASRTAKFSKSFSLHPTVDTDKITAQLNNGVLLVSAPKNVAKLEEMIKKIPVMQVTGDSIPMESVASSDAKVIDATGAPNEIDPDATIEPNANDEKAEDPNKSETV